MTGQLEDIGTNDGAFHSINVPLNEGCTDSSYEYIFGHIFDKVLKAYKPECIYM